MRADLPMPKRLSYSSLSSYADCGEKWRLERGYKLNGATWYATLAGSAIHEVTEKMDLKELGLFDEEVPTFESEFRSRVNQERKLGREIKPSGRKLKENSLAGGPNKKDFDWWLIYGPQFVQNWVDWKFLKSWTLAIMPDGSPGIEVTVRQPMGGKEHLGFIDRVYVTPDGDLVIVDLKSGNIPTSDLQLGSYGVGLWREYGLLAEWGTYWMASTGQLTMLKDLSQYSEEFIDAQYEMAWNGIQAGVFLPNVSSLCKGCGVQDYCRAVGGGSSHEVPVRSIVVPGEQVTADTTGGNE